MKRTTIQNIKELLDTLANTHEIKKEIELHNEIKKKLHFISNFKNEPVDCVLWVKNEKIEAND